MYLPKFLIAFLTLKEHDQTDDDDLLLGGKKDALPFDIVLKRKLWQVTNEFIVQ